MLKSDAIEQLAFCQIPEGTTLRRTTEGSTVLTLIDGADQAQLQGLLIIGAERRAELLEKYALDVPDTADLTVTHLRTLGEAIDKLAQLDRDSTSRHNFEVLETIEERRHAMHDRLSRIAETLGFTL